MSLLVTVPRLVVETTLKVVRLPIDSVLKLAGRDRSLAADATEAAVKDAVATVTGDDRLKADAAAQRVATDERRKAETLRDAATQATAKAEADLADDQAAAERERKAAEKRAAERKRKAEEKRKTDKAAAAKAERARKASAAKAAAAEKERLADKERRERLAQLDREAGALGEKEEALTAADEAQRLKDAAAAAKEKRKAD